MLISPFLIMLIQILVFFFLLVLFVFVLLVAVIRGLFRRTGLDRVFRMFDTSSSAHSSAADGSDRRRQNSGRHTTTPHGDTIIDRRSPEQASQKIFSESEGEYVDYKEE